MPEPFIQDYIRIVKGFRTFRSPSVVLSFTWVRPSVRSRCSDMKLHVSTRGILAQIVTLRAHCPARPPATPPAPKGRVALWKVELSKRTVVPRVAHRAHRAHLADVSSATMDDDCIFFFSRQVASSKCIRMSRGVSSSRASRLESATNGSRGRARDQRAFSVFK